MGINQILKKGFFMLLLIWLINWVLGLVNFAYLQPINIESISLSSFTSISFIVSLALYILIIGVTVEQLDKKVR